MSFYTFFTQFLTAVLFTVSAVGKSRRASFDAFVRTVGDLRIVPTAPARTLAAGTVGIEFLTIPLVLVPATRAVGLAVAGGLFAAFSLVAWLTERRGISTACNCFGVDDGRPLGRAHVVRNLVLTALCLAALVTAGLSGPPDLGVALLAAATAAVVAVPVVKLDDIRELFAGPSIRTR